MSGKRTGIIYMATSPSGKSYIGQTTRSIDDRKIGHACDAETHDYAFANAIKKYGIDNFEWKILYENIFIILQKNRMKNSDIFLRKLWMYIFHCVLKNKKYKMNIEQRMIRFIMNRI